MMTGGETDDPYPLEIFEVYEVIWSILKDFWLRLNKNINSNLLYFKQQ